MIENKDLLNCRIFASYTGVKLPLNLITPLDGEDVDKRITYFRGYYNDKEQLVGIEKVVYGEIEFEHNYQYHEDGRIQSAELIEPDEEPKVMQFD